MKSPVRGVAATKKAKAARDERTGRFETGDPFTDGELYDSLVKVVHAVTDLEPMLSASVLVFKQIGDEPSAAAAASAGVYLSTLKRHALDSLMADRQSFLDAKKKRLDAKRLGNVTLEEQQRVQRQCEEWELNTVTPLSLARDHPAVIASFLHVAMACSVRVEADGKPLAIPSEVVQLLQHKGGDQ